MDWLQGLIILIPIAVFVLSHLARNREEPRRPARREQPPAGEPAERPRRTSAEIDDFLREVRRRRESSEGRKRTARTEPPVREPEPLRARPIPPALTAPAPPPPASAPAPRRDEILAAIPVPDEVVTARVVSEPVPGQTVRAEVPMAPPPPPATRVSVVRRRLPPPATPRQLLQMLRNPQTVSSLMVLREVLDRPVSRRGRRV